jgi:hypothetical protein
MECLNCCHTARWDDYLTPCMQCCCYVRQWRHTSACSCRICIARPSHSRCSNELRYSHATSQDFTTDWVSLCSALTIGTSLCVRNYCQRNRWWLPLEINGLPRRLDRAQSSDSIKAACRASAKHVPLLRRLTSKVLVSSIFQYPSWELDISC